MKISNKLASAILIIALGVLFVIFQADVVSIAMTIVGVTLIVLGIIDIINKLFPIGIVKSVVGVCVIIFGWMLISLALYVFAALLLIYGILQLYELIKNNVKPKNDIMIFVGPIITIVAAICLLFNQGGSISWIFIVAGVFLIIEGVIMLLEQMKSKK